VHRFLHRGAAGVPGVFDDNEFGVGPGMGEFPCGDDGAAEITATVDQDAWNAGQLARFVC
jgi:hypothetical protein